ncbi:MAG TPA: hypothetical protein VEB18_00015 [Candidatus Paceibacterota bacterium]|nr:hypothetical protein [Candidatus Paceibacterota bacterium]
MAFNAPKGTIGIEERRPLLDRLNALVRATEKFGLTERCMVYLGTTTAIHAICGTGPEVAARIRNLSITGELQTLGVEALQDGVDVMAQANRTLQLNEQPGLVRSLIVHDATVGPESI